MVQSLVRSLVLGAAVLAAAFTMMAAGTQGRAEEDKTNLIYMDVGNAKETYGRVVIKLRPDLAPHHVERIKELTKAGFYNGIVFHRVIDGFMAQTGDPTGTGMGGSDKPDLKAEFSKAHHYRGICSMARAQDPDSANSQFFIMLADNTFLDGQYSIWGEVIKGMEFIDRVKKGDSSDNGQVVDPDRIVKMQLASDVPDAAPAPAPDKKTN